MFIHGLVSAAFDTELDDVLMANAVRGPMLGDLISRAADALTVWARSPKAFTLADTALLASVNDGASAGESSGPVWAAEAWDYSRTLLLAIACRAASAIQWAPDARPARCA